MEEWQLEDLMFCLQNMETALVRTRNGSKTKDCVILALYLAYLGYDGLFYVAETTQMEQPQKYLNELILHTFLKYCLIDNHSLRTKRFRGGGSLKLRLLSEKKAKSPRSDFIIYDEEALMDEEAYRMTFGQTKNSQLGIRIHASTPIAKSVFHKNVNRLTKTDSVRIRKYMEIGFLNQKQFEIDREVMPEFEFRREYECSFETPAGRVFGNVIQSDGLDLNLLGYKCAGIDWNPVNDHWLVAGRWSTDGTAFVITDVINVSESFEVKMNDVIYERLVPFFVAGNKLCAEDGGVNMGFTAWLRKKVSQDTSRSGKQVYYAEVTEKEKYNSVIRLMNAVVYVPEEFEELYEELINTRWDDTSVIPKIVKNRSNSPHRLDALLMAVNSKIKHYSGRMISI